MCIRDSWWINDSRFWPHRRLFWTSGRHALCYCNCSFGNHYYPFHPKEQTDEINVSAYRSKNLVFHKPDPLPKIFGFWGVLTSSSNPPLGASLLTFSRFQSCWFLADRCRKWRLCTIFLPKKEAIKLFWWSNISIRVVNKLQIARITSQANAQPPFSAPTCQFLRSLT